MVIDKQIEKEIKEYCSYNQIKDVNKFMNDMLRKQFTIEKYGELPFNKNVIISENNNLSTLNSKKNDLIIDKKDNNEKGFTQQIVEQAKDINIPQDNKKIVLKTNSKIKIIKKND